MYTTDYTIVQEINTFVVAIVDCLHVESATAAFKDFLIAVAQKNSTNQTAIASFGLITISKELEVLSQIAYLSVLLLLILIKK